MLRLVKDQSQGLPSTTMVPAGVHGPAVQVGEGDVVTNCSAIVFCCTLCALEIKNAPIKRHIIVTIAVNLNVQDSVSFFTVPTEGNDFLIRRF